MITKRMHSVEKKQRQFSRINLFIFVGNIIFQSSTKIFVNNYCVPTKKLHGKNVL